MKSTKLFTKIKTGCYSSLQELDRVLQWIRYYCLI